MARIRMRRRSCSQLNNVPSDAGAFGFPRPPTRTAAARWKPAPARSGDTYAFDVSSATWGFAYTCQANVNLSGTPTALRNVVEYHFAVAERTSWTGDILTRCTDRIAYVALSGNILNPLRGTNSGTYRVAYNGTAVFINKTTTTPTTPCSFAPGTHDLLVLHGSDRSNPGDFLVDGAIVQRNVAVTAAMTRDVDVQAAVPHPAADVLAAPPSGAPAQQRDHDRPGHRQRHQRRRWPGSPRTPLVSPALYANLARGGGRPLRPACHGRVRQEPGGDCHDRDDDAGERADHRRSDAARRHPRRRARRRCRIRGSCRPGPGMPVRSGTRDPWRRRLRRLDDGGSACTITWAAMGLARCARSDALVHDAGSVRNLPGWSQALQFSSRGTMATGKRHRDDVERGAMGLPAPQPPGPIPAGTQSAYSRNSTFTRHALTDVADHLIR